MIAFGGIELEMSELLVLGLAIALTPLILITLREIAMPGRGLFAAAYLSIVAAFVFTVLEGIAAYELFNVLEHASYALSAVLMAAVAWRERRAWAPSERG